MDNFVIALETERQKALESYSIEYKINEKQFDEITRFASIICNRPISLITFIDDNQQWIKSSAGMWDAKCTDRNDSFCKHTIQSDDIFEVEDTLQNPAFKENPLVTNDPRIRFYAGAPIITPEGYRIGALCVIDQQPGKLTEQQREALTVLSHAVISLLEVRKQHDKLLLEKQKAVHAARAKADFLSTMSHEIRTPLNGIIGIAHLLNDEHPAAHQVEYIKTLKFSANNLMSIVNDILDFSKIEAGGITLEQIQFNLNELLIEIKGAHQLRAQDKGIKLKLKRDDDIPELVLGDPSRLSQILNNLIGNAIKFTHHGEVLIDASLQDRSSQHASVFFSIQDTGIGIPEDKQEILFQQFTQVDSSITRKFGGTGLGLAITKNLLELHGSPIKLHSELRKGSTFSFTIEFKLPQKDDKTEIKNPERLHQLERFQNPTILLVEDNEVNTLIAKAIMKNWGVKIMHAANGEEALSLLTTQNFDLVLMDLQMPVMDGYETTRAIRQTGFSLSALPIIGLSASAMDSEKHQALAAGMNDFVRKPFNPLDLNLKMKKYLHKKFTTQKSW